MRPIIGITPFFTDERKYSLNVKYVDAVAAHGVTPIVMAYDAGSVEEYLRMVSGVMLTGGGDVCAGRFGEARHEKAGEPTHARDEFELALCRAAVAAGVPLFGICRGAQVMNVALGGNLHQHIDGHDHPDRATYAHSVRLSAGSKLRGFAGRDEIRVNSIHHQSVGERLGRGVSVSAVSPDGVAEAVEVSAFPFALGVQWHPEELAASDAAQAAIFRAFVAASAYR
ncbi:MAG: gamma-glutamyl-gamma-aminobutyrate hydrolase family protein [Defluviitaleaceae bacterium]|nr:gamma-glutamyl-gamma-aminobutyrate hydrolase family protein [Defluviitaleaceae bacterium]